MTNDYIAGTVGDKNRRVAVGKDIAQSETTATNYFDFGRVIRDKFEAGTEQGVEELTRFVYEIYKNMALLEYRLRGLELWVRVGIVIIVGVVLFIAYGVYNGHVQLVK
jgi:hypothetical protein